MLFNKLLPDIVGNVPTILISCLVNAVLYILLLIVLRVIHESEASELPFGVIWVTFGRMIGAY